MKFRSWIKLLISANLVAAPVIASPIFEGTNADLWLIDTEEGRVTGITGYDYGQWLEQYTEGLYQLEPDQQALVNNLANSSQLMTPNQPMISLQGLAATNFSGATPEGKAELLIAPVEGEYNDTIAVQVQVAADLVDRPNTELQLQLGQNGTQTFALEAEALAAAGVREAEGYYTFTGHLVRDGTHTVQAQVSDNSGLIGNISATYTLTSDHPDGFRRDSDGDGIPDLVEAEIGMDPDSDEWLTDTDGDGWSDFDLWLRNGDLDPQTNLPKDSDQDGWSDFDENLRGTNPLDPDINLEVAAGETEGGEVQRQGVLRYKDYPAARRLYEVEYRLTGELLPTPAENSMAWDALTAATITGTPTYQQNRLLTDKDLDKASVTAADLAPRLLLTAAETALKTNQLPSMRVPAGSSNIINAGHRYAPTEGKGFVQVYKAWLNRRVDADPAGYLSAQGVGDWTTVEEWKQGFIDYLEQALVVDQAITLDTSTTVPVNLLEAGYSREAALKGHAPLQLFGYPDQPVVAELTRAVEHALTQIAVDAADDESLQRNLDDVMAALKEGINSQVLTTTASEIQKRITQPQPGQRSDRAIVAELLGLSLTACPNSDDKNTETETQGELQVLDACAQPSDPVALDSEAQQKLYQLRLLWLPDALAQVAADETLLSALDDSDQDNRVNVSELDRPLEIVTLPWSEDYDDDGLNDGEDPCPQDPYDACSDTPVLPKLAIANEVITMEGRPTLVSISLDRAAETDTLVEYRVFAQSDDSAEVGVDFEGITGTVIIPAGERAALIPVTVFEDGTEENVEVFSVEITGVDHAVVANAGPAQVAINDYRELAPEAIVANVSLSVDERATVSLDASGSYEPTGTPLSFNWTQVDASGHNVSLANSPTPSFSAPEVRAQVSLDFQVTVTNAAGQSDSELVSIAVNPVNDPPRVTGSPSYTATAGQLLTIAHEDLASHITEPDGDSISFGSIIEQPNGELTPTATGFDYLSKAGGERALSQAPISNYYALTDDMVIFVEEVDATTSRTVVQTVSTGERTILPLNFVPSNIATGAKPLAYLYDSQNDEVHLWEPGQPLRKGVFVNGFRYQKVDPLTGDLYTCDSYNVGNWERTDYETLSVIDTGVECVGAFNGLPSGKLGQERYCVAETRTLDCTDGQGGLAEAHRLAPDPDAGKFQGVQEVDGNLLLFVSNVAIDGLQYYQTWLLTPDLQLQKLLELQSGTSGIVEVERLGTGELLMVYDVDDLAEVYQWSGDPAQPPTLLAADIPLNGGGVGDLASAEGELYWIRTIAYAQLGIHTLDPNTGSQQLLKEDAAGAWNRFPLRLIRQDAHWLYLTPTEMASSDLPQCHLQRLEESGTATQVASDLECYSLLETAEHVIFARRDMNTYQRTAWQYGGEVFTGETQFKVRVNDSTGKSVILPVAITVQAAE